MSIFTNRIIQEAYQKVYRNRLIESRQYIYENALDNKVNELAKKIAIDLVGQDKYGKEPVLDEHGRPETYQTSGKPKVYDRVYIKHKVGLLINNAKKLDGKFFLGTLRIFRELLKRFDIHSEELRRECSDFNKILGIICDDTHHQQEYDNNLNGKTLDELKELFGQEVKIVSDKRKEALNSKAYTKNERYTIVPCNEWEDLLPYGKPLTTWCVAQRDGKSMYDSYTNKGLNKFYVCLRDDYKTVKKTVGPNAPLDDYGLSMIAINVDMSGELNTCTVRWNHSNGGSDNAMTVEQISDLLGVNFYETFEPRDAFDKLIYDESDPICSVLGFNKDDEDNYYKIEDNKIGKYRCCYSDKEIVCLADKFLTWFDLNTGNEIEPPERVEGDFTFYKCKNITSLERLPKEVGGSVIYIGCETLTSLEGSPEKVGDHFSCYRCKNLTSLKGAPKEVGGNFDCSYCEKLTSLDGAPEKVGGSFYCPRCHGITSLKGAPKEVGGDFDCYECYKLKSLEGSPEKVGGDFNCSSCKNLTSLEGAPIEVGGDFECSLCRSLITLEGAPKKVGKHFDCTSCNSLTSLKGSPREVGGSFYCYSCYNLTSLEYKPEHIGGDFITPMPRKGNHL